MFNAYHVKESRRLPDPYATMAGVLCMANALSNHVFVACCDAVGECNGTRFAGQSMVANQWGAPLAGPASDEEEAIVYAAVSYTHLDVYKRQSVRSPADWKRSAASLYPLCYLISKENNREEKIP